MPSAVIFDIGNVLLEWDARALYRRLLPDEAAIDAFFAETGFHDWNLGFDRGMDWDEGVASHSARFPHRAELLAAFHERWHETVVGPIAGSVAILEALDAEGVPLYAITNFAGPKWEESRERFPFLRRFRDVVVSGHERMLKPDPAIYRLCLDRNGLRAEDCVFIDDNAANVEGARVVGIDAVRFTAPEALAADLGHRGLLPGR